MSHDSNTSTELSECLTVIKASESESVSKHITGITPERAFELLTKVFVGIGGTIVDKGQSGSLLGLRMSRTLNGYDFFELVTSVIAPNIFRYKVEGEAPALNYRAQVTISDTGSGGVCMVWSNSFDNRPGESFSAAKLFEIGLNYIEKNKCIHKL